MIYLLLIWTFFKIGLFTIGGGYAMIPMIESEVVEKGWITEVELANFLAISESTPGPFAINMATFIGYSQGGIVGAVCATVGVVMPSWIIVVIIAKMISKFLNCKYVNYAMSGARPVVIGLIIAVAIGLIKTSLLVYNDGKYLGFSHASFIIMVITFIMLRFKKTSSPLLLILISGVLGVAMFGLFKFF